MVRNPSTCTSSFVAFSDMPTVLGSSPSRCRLRPRPLGAAASGAAASGAVKGPLAQRDMEAKTHAVSNGEIKHLNLWQRIIEPVAGFGAAAAGAMECEGAAAAEMHRECLNSTLGRCVRHVLGR